MAFYAAIGFAIVSRRDGPVAADVPAAVPILVGVVALAASAAIARVAAVPHNSAERFRGLALLSAGVLDVAALAGVFLTVAMWRVWPALLLAFAGILGIAAFVLPASNEWFRANAGGASARGPVAPS
jgi:hypothetical protein